jgi:hypothetical protein
VSAEPAEVQRIHEQDRLRGGARVRKPDAADDTSVRRLQIDIVEANAVPVLRLLRPNGDRLAMFLWKLKGNRRRARLFPFGRAYEVLHRHAPIAPHR